MKPTTNQASTKKTLSKSFTELNYISNQLHPVDDATPLPKRKALAVGFAVYDTTTSVFSTPNGPVCATTGHGNLWSCTHDVHAVASKLAKNSVGNNFDVTVIMDQDTDMCHKPDGMTWMEYFEQEVTRMFRESTPEDTLLLYYTGHGTPNGAEGPDFVFPQDPSCHKMDYYAFANLLELIDQSQFKNCILLLDCCYGGDMANMLDDQRYAKLKRGVTIITAGRAGRTVDGQSDFFCEVGKTQDDWAIDGGDNDFTLLEERRGKDDKPVQVEYSYFTGYLVEALAGGAADPMGMVTTTSIYQYISEAMGSNLTRFTEGEGSKNRPMLKTNTDEAVLLKIIGRFLNETDLNLLYYKFKVMSKRSRIFNFLPSEIQNDLILKLSDVEGHKLLERSINKLLRMQLIEGKYVHGPLKEFYFYRLTARGRHYRDMIDHLYFFGLELEKSAEN